MRKIQVIDRMSLDGMQIDWEVDIQVGDASRLVVESSMNHERLICA